MPNLIARRTIYASVATCAASSLVYLISRPQAHTMGSASDLPSRTFVFPRDLFSPKRLKVNDVEQCNHNTKRITFELPGGKSEVSGMSPGGAVFTQHTPKDAWLPVFRPYTPAHDLDEKGIFQLLIKRYDNGRASTHMHSLVPGDYLTVWGPKPSPWTVPDDQRDILLIAGGAAIAPIYSLAKGILRNPEDQTRIRLFWGVNSIQDIMLQDEFATLERQYPGRLQVTYVVSGPEVQPGMPIWADEKRFRRGYIDKSLIQEAIEGCNAGTWGDAKGRKVFICGPPAMEAALTMRQGILAQLGVTRRQVHRF